MAFKSIIGATCACLAVVSFSADAALVSRLGGLAYYDDVADLTWLADANASGLGMTWLDANTWVAGLNVNGVTGWRLPDTVYPDSSTGCGGWSTYNCAGSEMGNLFYNVLGGVANTKLQDTHNSNYDLFSNIQTSYYWSATGYDSSSAWAFQFDSSYSTSGDQPLVGKGSRLAAWAVQSGDVGASVVPVPAAVWLFGSGLIGLIGVARRKA